ncbi:hypothetical protein E2L06_01765 [Haloterrigena sp. H1]|uniref:hypothetical protein n=1 Tax=Haloterrigena sp. H1 TaxID=2552943 RepID=UPI00110EF2E2|nr:hypothetical protein [Haloterrigena sp. H1]TMT85393.1 hypothetical protein E2L06_01765 [Haloterrigena sp. H1]
MPFFGGKTEPGSDAFLPCPECGEDEIYSQSDGLLSFTEYICNNCGYEAEKHEVKEFHKEVMDEMKKKQAVDALPERISDPELSQQVKDRKAEGWDIEEITDSGGRVVMSSTNGGTIGGHALTGALTGLWTFGMGNVAYDKMSKKKNKERIVLRADGDSNPPNSNTKNPTELIRELNQLKEEGLISDTEFEEKKQQLLDEM